MSGFVRVEIICIDFSMKGTDPFWGREWDTTATAAVTWSLRICIQVSNRDLSIESVQRPMVAPFTVWFVENGSPLNKHSPANLQHLLMLPWQLNVPTSPMSENASHSSISRYTGKQYKRDAMFRWEIRYVYHRQQILEPISLNRSTFRSLYTWQKPCLLIYM
jgi:hypothetical protein